MNGRALEVAWRRLWMRAIAAALPGGRRVRAPDWNSRPFRILFLRFERIGDMIMSTGVVRALARSHRSFTVDVVTSPAAAPVLDGLPFVGRVYVLDRRSWRSYVRLARELRRDRHDVIVDGRLNNPPVFTSTPLLMLASGARFRVGAAGGGGDLVYNLRAAPYDRSATHYIDGSTHLGVPFGIDPASTDWQPEIVLSEAERDSAESRWAEAARLLDDAAATVGGPPQEQDDPPASPRRHRIRLLVNLSASEPARRWPDERFAEVLRNVRQAHPGLAVVTVGLPREWPSVRAVAAAAGALPVETPALRDVLALVGTATVVLTPDTSISHAASAFRTRAVVLIKREHLPYAPYRTPGETIPWDGPSIGDFPADSVIAALERALDELA